MVLQEYLTMENESNDSVAGAYEILIIENDKKHELASPSSDEETRSEAPLCTREQIRNRGQWRTFERPEAPYTATVDWENTCYKNKGDEPAAFQDSEWVVNDECTFNPFNATRLCHILENRTVAFLGDSITFQQFNSLSYLTGGQDVFRFASKCFTRTCPNFTSKLYWMRDNRATAKYWSNMIRQVDPEVIVLNRGAHYSSSDTMLQELNETLHTALQWQEDCDERDRNCVLLWRTTAPGFPNCQEIPGPLSNATAAEQIIANTSWYMEEEFRQKFHWWEFASQNQMVEAMIQDFRIHKELRISFLDFYDLAILRPDHHINAKDCLHWCLPGPMDASNQLLLHQLEVAKQEREYKKHRLLSEKTS